MSDTPRVAFDGVWKRFRRGLAHDSLRDLVPAIAKRAFKGADTNRTNARDFWALSDVSFNVQPGEVLGIIGANGAGKSTTLKILNRIIEPTSGVAEVTGRIGALIEVSAGFHPDLTGRQNLFLQGAIMGMSRSEVSRKFEAIVEFAGLQDFIDTPVKRYSSGMNARLGFSIAAHLEPEVLIIDEVLAVGDYTFQKKAFGRIKEMASAGAPVVLVSHQLDRIQELCTKAILLERGAVRFEGTPRECINAYVAAGSANSINSRYGDVGVDFLEAVGLDGVSANSGSVLRFQVEGLVRDDAKLEPSWTPNFRVVHGETGIVLHSVVGDDRGVSLPRRGSFSWSLAIQCNMQPGWYRVEFAIWDRTAQAEVLSGPSIRIEVLESRRFWGDLQLNSEWSSMSSAATE
jgi:lipopolysaccharide transport system ATP-binding protein